MPLPDTVEMFAVPLVGTPEAGQPSALPGADLAFRSTRGAHADARGWGGRSASCRNGCIRHPGRAPRPRRTPMRRPTYPL